MNTSFTLKNVEIPVSEEHTIKIGELSTTVHDYNLLEGLQVVKELPALLREVKDIVVDGIKEAQSLTVDISNQNHTPRAVTPEIDEAIRHLADVTGVDPTQIQIVRTDEVEKEFSPSF